MAAVRKHIRKISSILLIAYLMLLCYFLFFSENLGRTAEIREYRYNLTLFREIRRFYMYRDILGTEAFMLNVVGNVAAFMPLGFFSAILMRPKEKWYWVTLRGFELSLLVELLQFITRLGCADVDDLFLNTLGTWTGYICYWIWIRIDRRSRSKNRTYRFFMPPPPDTGERPL